MGEIIKAVIPAAGLGTRFLPATKAMPKEMLPVVDKPAIQYVVEEAFAAGLDHILMITGRNKSSLENHFDKAFELEATLQVNGQFEKLNAVSAPTELGDIHFVRQGSPKGLGHAVSKAQTFTGDEPFALLLGDDLIDPEEDLLRKMVDFASENSATVIGLINVPYEDIHKYGIADLGETRQNGFLNIRGFKEKPTGEDISSNLAIIGRYILQPSIYQALREISPGHGGEIQLTDALDLMARNPSRFGPIYGYVFSGKRYDTGDKLSYLKAIVEIASGRPDLSNEFNQWLLEFTRTFDEFS